ncbi:unnamed protein product [Clonostachys rhizophaga]|uniref:Uncharacterized protein n=1 Tax=Clonostachys rhizophaga TaxID=160324 RepID=A0A9N9UZN2_9HYPO|nr:unnamed protein product [Clonostachys rhizophaga]
MSDSGDHFTPSIISDSGESGPPAIGITPKPVDFSSPSTAAIEFEEFSLIGPNGYASSQHVQPEHMEAFNEYLFKNYNVQVNSLLGIFIVLFCGDYSPPKDELPFSIAGCIAVWKNMDDFDDGYDLWSFVDSVGSAGAEPLDPNILSDVENGEISNEVLFYLAKYVFTECEGISVCGQGRTLLVEFPEISVEDFANRLDTLPRAITNLPFKLEYHNGPLGIPTTPF